MPSSERLAVALVWHMHQPYYRDDATGEFLLPWVRLRATKDYVHMLGVLERHPEARVGMNMVPSLLRQIEMYTAGDGTDYHRDICLRSAAELEPGERAYLVEMALRGGFTRRVTAFAPLYALLARLATADARRLDDATVRDLQVWLQLGWIEAGEVSTRPDLLRLAGRGHGFSEEDKLAVDAAQRELLATVIPRYCALVRSGVIEPMTSPFYHPIIPLLIDSAAARVAVPGISLPDPPWRWPADADTQIREGLEYFGQLTGVRPAGVWPPECSVSPAAAERFAAAGFRWAVSDEGVLDRTLSVSSRTSGDLYRPHRTSSGLALVFRDAVLSDRIGFSYAGLDASAAVADLLGRLHDIAAGHRHTGPQLCTIALDGENCWDFYAENGTPFLDALYAGLAADDQVEMTHAGTFIDLHSETVAELTTLHSGSWIDTAFTTWMGDPAHTRAWDRLIAARAALDEAGGPQRHPGAHRELMIAEGSDWYWWFGVRHDSGMDDAWDALYRTHIRNAYVAMDRAVPGDITTPILRSGTASSIGPLRALDPGARGDAEWACAGRFDLRRGLGAMHPAAVPVDGVEFGAAAATVHVRLVTLGGARDPSAAASSERGAVGVRATAWITGQDGRRRSASLAEGRVSLAADPGPARLDVMTPDGRSLIPGGGVPVTVPRKQERLCVAVVAVEFPPARGGNLADLVEQMTGRIAAGGHDCVVIVPGHDALLAGGGGLRIEALDITVEGLRVDARVLQRAHGSAQLLIVDVPALFAQHPVYDSMLDGERYIAFSRIVHELLGRLSLHPHAVICHEWQTAVVAALVRGGGGVSIYASLGSSPSRYSVPAALVAGAGLDSGTEDEVELHRLGAAGATLAAGTEALARDPLGVLSGVVGERVR